MFAPGDRWLVHERFVKLASYCVHSKSRSVTNHALLWQKRSCIFHEKSGRYTAVCCFGSPNIQFILSEFNCHINIMKCHKYQPCFRSRSSRLFHLNSTATSKLWNGMNSRKCFRFHSRVCNWSKRNNVSYFLYFPFAWLPFSMEYFDRWPVLAHPHCHRH